VDRLNFFKISGIFNKLDPTALWRELSLEDRSSETRKFSRLEQSISRDLAEILIIFHFDCILLMLHDN
jgi:hypothetical protein